MEPKKNDLSKRKKVESEEEFLNRVEKDLLDFEMFQKDIEKSVDELRKEKLTYDQIYNEVKTAVNRELEKDKSKLKLKDEEELCR